MAKNPSSKPRASKSKALATAPAPRKFAPISAYPDFTMALAMLRSRSNNLPDGERKTLIDKWITQLVKIQADITKLKKLEDLAGKVASPQQGTLPL